MSRTVPDWFEDPDTCDVDGCDGKVWYEMEGGRFDPVAVYKSTCSHSQKVVRGTGGRPRV